MSFDPTLGGCFGNADLIFAVHPMDEGRAFEWLQSLRKRQIGWKEAQAQIVEYLKSKGAGEEHIKEQIERARHKLEPWLFD